MERCIADLETRYAKIKLNVSPPIVPFRETIVPAATVDMVNEIIIATDESKNASKTITITTSNKLGRIKLLAVPLDADIIELLEKSTDLFKALKNISLAALPERTIAAITDLRKALEMAFKQSTNDVLKKNTIEHIWSIGPKKIGTNILLNVSDYKHQSFWDVLGEKKKTQEHSNDIRYDLENSLLNGFQLATLAGPLCEEPMHGVCFIIEEWFIDCELEQSTQMVRPFFGKFSLF